MFLRRLLPHFRRWLNSECKPQRRPSTSLFLETLEDRLVMTAVSTYSTLIGGILHMTGSSSDDTITVDKDTSGHYVLTDPSSGNTVASYNVSDVLRIQIDTYGGNDTINIEK